MKYGDVVRISFADRPDVIGTISHVPSDTGDMFYIVPQNWEIASIGPSEMAFNPSCSVLVCIEVIE